MLTSKAETNIALQGLERASTSQNLFACLTLPA
jgi:hypothetical protein